MYYFASQESSYIYYYDESSDSYGKLCGKAECTHDSKKCNAYIEVWKSTLQVYDGALYFIGDGGTLYRMELTGDAREEVMRLPAGNTANFKVVLHRGYVYYSEIKEVVEAGQSRYDYILRQARIGQADSSKVLIERKIDKGIPLEHWWIIGNTLYQYVADVFSLDNGVISAFYQYDIKSGELKVLQDGETPWSMTSYLVRGTEIMTVQNNKQQERRIVKGETVEPF